MFNALSGMGGGGHVDPTAANNANSALYTTFVIFGVLGSGNYNIFGPRLSVAAGCTTYILYAGSFLYCNRHQDQTFAIFAGALFGGVIGGLIPFILNYNRIEAETVSDSTYIAFMCFMSAGTLLVFAILPPSRVIRDDDTRSTNIVGLLGTCLG
ncbi:UNC93-like protein 1-like isoform X1 [Tripterygium wilfordii]|uniref:UNC93-like protein 1-like isoform X1 n=1 Tax=Tripterygium wilfordii TaxID=458696 RepID=A0A7J7CD60_TRIWF|nr:UNC93-like protein 1-like isoform X1 [Tripterygium wilfordii]